MPQPDPLPPPDPPIRQVLVIGGAGYIGSALLPKLLHCGYRVRLLDLLIFGTHPIAAVLGHPHLEICRANFLQVDKLVAAMQGVQAVIHLGAIVGDPACALDETLAVGVNLMATRMIAETARCNRIRRFIFASTCSVYGAGQHLLAEDAPLNPVSLYARTKIDAEDLLRHLADEDFAPTFLRFGTIYGLSGRTRFDLVVNLLTARALLEGQIPLFGGDQWRPFLHVDDAALAILSALQAPLPLVGHETFNVGSNEQNYTIRQIGHIIQRLIPEAQLIHMASAADPRNYRVNFDKIRHRLAFLPQWTVEQGVRQVIAAIQSGQVHDYRQAKYNNLKCVRLFRMVQQALAP